MKNEGLDFLKPPIHATNTPLKHEGNRGRFPPKAWMVTVTPTPQPLALQLRLFCHRRSNVMEDATMAKEKYDAAVFVCLCVFQNGWN